MVGPSRPHPPSAREKTIEDLRPLLVGPVQRRLQEVEERLDQHLDEMVADVLPKAVVRGRAKGDELAWALGPLVERSVADTVRKAPVAFAEAIAPAMGPAIRKAVAGALRAAMQRFDLALERSLSVRSLRWRVEAWRTGRPFSEVVLLRSLTYRVEQLFLIHRGTGILLQHLTAEHGQDRDPDQIAAMLSAIERFAFDAFREDARLERFQVGDLTAWVEHGPLAILVAVVRGTAPEDYEASLREALDRTHLEHLETLADFRGDSTPFAGTRVLLAGCMQESRRASRRAWVASLLAVTVLLAMSATLFGLFAIASRRRFDAYVGALRGEPGLVVIAAERRGGRYAFTGLRDPLATDPAAALARSGLDPAIASLRFSSFYSLDPRLSERRAAAILRPPEGVSLTLRGGVLEIAGVARERWIERARTLAATVPGVEALAAERLYPEESVARERSLARALDAVELFFPPGSALLSAEQVLLLDRVAAEARRLVALAPEAGTTARIDVTGYTDPTGSAESNQELALARAEHVAAALRARGVTGRLSVRSGGVRVEAASRPGEDPWRSRCVALHVDLRGPGLGQELP
jgi:OOP family OmpA-OmpF porin